MTRSWPEALAWLRDQPTMGPIYPPGHCLQAVREAYDVPAKYPSAAEAWEHTRYRVERLDLVKGLPGSLVWFTGGSQGFGHVGIDLGRGFLASVDYVRPGVFSVVSMAMLAAWSPSLRYVGHSRDVNGVLVLRRRPWRPARFTEPAS